MLGLEPSVLISRALTLLVAFTLHELAHAVTADYLGDPTPRNMGRLTLNPIKHLDPFGTILLLLTGFGWAKPVVVNPLNMRGNPRRDMAIVALAGPLSNILMATIAVIPFRLGLMQFTQTPTPGIVPTLPFVMSEFIWINLILAFFNLIPIPPLDGSKILYAILPVEMAYKLRPLEQYGFLLLMGVVFLVPSVMNVLVIFPSVASLRFLLG